MTMMKRDPLPWLLEADDEQPGVRYFALRDLLGLPEEAREVRSARDTLMRTGPVPVIMAAQYPEGFWVKPGGGYSPKYRSTVWSLLLLAELGADPDAPGVRAGCGYYLGHSLASNQGFSVNRKPVPSGVLHCLNGNMLFALQRLGFADDARVRAALDWQARAVTGDQPMAYYASGTSAPDFACGVNGGLPCGWGANKALRALLEVPAGERSDLVDRALQAGAAFLLSRDPVAADYPFTERISSTWFKLGFPLSYWSDVLETLSNLIGLGYADHPLVVRGLSWLMDKRDDKGRWKLENSLTGKMWINLERRGRPSKWVTLRAARALRRAGAYSPAGM